MNAVDRMAYAANTAGEPWNDPRHPFNAGYPLAANADDAMDPHERAHEAHGGDEAADPENCMVCRATLDRYLRYGAY